MVLSDKRIEAIKRRVNNIVNYSRCNDPFEIAALYDIDVRYIEIKHLEHKNFIYSYIIILNALNTHHKSFSFMIFEIPL